MHCVKSANELKCKYITVQEQCVVQQAVYQWIRPIAGSWSQLTIFTLDMSPFVPLYQLHSGACEDADDDNDNYHHRVSIFYPIAS